MRGWVFLNDADYPPLLRWMDHPPPLLTVKGDPAVFGLPAVAIVGARNASVAGTRMARTLATGLGREGFLRGFPAWRAGVDAAAHNGGLLTGTVAVLAGGVDRPYPPENTDLCDEIAGQGSVLSRDAAWLGAASAGFLRAATG